MFVPQVDYIGRYFVWDSKNRGPVSQQVRHDKDPSLKAISNDKNLKSCSSSVQMETSQMNESFTSDNLIKS